MSKTLHNYNLIINSKKEFILFYLSEQGEVKYTKYDVSNKPIETLTLYKDSISKYAVTIDNKDNIHLIALAKSGELIYFIYKYNNWSNAIITKFDLRSNLYNNIGLLIIDKNVNIIYNYANLINSKLWTIQHIMGNKGIWDRHNIVSIMTDRFLAHFHFDLDSFNTIHLLYNSMERNNHQIYHTFYNSYTKKWNPIPQKLSSTNTSSISPFLFIDTKDNIHAIWLEKINMNNILKYSRLNSKRNERYLWSQIKIPYITNCDSMPIIFEEKGILKIVYLTDKAIGFLYSLDYGTTWFKGDVLEISPFKVGLVRVSKNCIESNNVKITHAYSPVEDALHFYFLDSINPIDNIDIDRHLIEFNQPVEDLNLIDTEEEIISEIYNPSKTQEQIMDMLSNIIETQYNIEKNIEKILELLDNRKDSIFDKLFGSFK